MAWDKSKPTTTSKIKDGPGIFLGNWDALDDWTDVEHYGLSDASSAGYHRLSQDKTIIFDVPGYCLVAGSITPAFMVPCTCTITKVYAYIKTAPQGANLICDINKNGTSIWAATQANRITITAGTTSASQTSFDTTALVETDVLTLDLDQVGSTTSGANLTVEIKVTQTA